MKPVHCRVRHDTDAGTSGDCIRACVASLLDREPETVPHFADGVTDGRVAYAHVTEWLVSEGYAPFLIHYDGSIPLTEILSITGQNSPHAYYMLFGGLQGGGDHVVICRGGEVFHDPAWYKIPIVGPGTSGIWQIMLIVKI